MNEHSYIGNFSEGDYLKNVFARKGGSLNENGSYIGTLIYQKHNLEHALFGKD